MICDRTLYQTELGKNILVRYASGAEKDELYARNEIYLNEVTESHQVNKKMYNLVKVIMRDLE